MYELVVGKVPFKGDSPVEVAIKQMRDKIPDITMANPDIPQSIENIILRACAKNPKNRYESMEEMHNDLETALNKERFNEARVVYEYPESNFDEPEKLPAGAKRSDRNGEKNEDKKDKKISKSVKILIGVAIALVSVLLFIFVIYPKFISKPSIEVPDVSDMTVSQAEKTLEDEGFEVATKTKKKSSDDIKKGKVIETDPEAGRTIKKGTKITLIVSSGSKKLTIEDYTGENYYEIKAKLEAAGIIVEIETKDVVKSDDAKENVVLSQDVEPGEKLGKGDTIILTIPNLYETYPDFVKESYTVEDVKAFCVKHDITLDINYQADASKKENTIIYQNMAAGTKVKKDSTLKITVVVNTPKEPGEVNEES